MRRTEEEKNLLAKLASGVLDGMVGDEREYRGYRSVFCGKYIKDGEPVSYRQGESTRFFNGKENERIPGKREDEHYDTDDRKLEFLQRYLTGILYRDGGLLIPDTEKAQHYLELAAQQNHAAAQYALGILFLSNEPETQNPAQGFYWLERAAQNGSDYAAYRLGKEYLSGKNAPKESERAAEYVRMAAEWGNPYAQYLLGKLYLSGDGVPQDRDAAYDWFQKAQAQGHDYAGFFMDRIERPEPPNILLSATRLLYHMGKIFQQSAPAPQSGGIQIDRKRLAKLRRMRMAAGHKADDHEQEQTSGTMSMGW